jgi:hypothetical protein
MCRHIKVCRRVYLSCTAPAEACYARRITSDARIPSHEICRPVRYSCAAKVLGFEVSVEKYSMVIKLKILSSKQFAEDPAQVLRTYPGPR